MTVLSACQSAAVRLVGRKPSTIFSSTEQLEVELQDLVNEVAKDIAKSHDWQALIGIHTLTGDGTTTAFDLPADYDRMLLDSEIYDETNWAWGYDRINSVNDWLELQIVDWSFISPGVWGFFGDQLQFIPAPLTGSDAQFVYIKNTIVRAENGDLQTSFTADDDTFILNERLLTLGLVWRWREQKRMDYGADQANFEKAFADIAGKDGGAKVVRNRRYWNRRRFSYAYPWPLG